MKSNKGLTLVEVIVVLFIIVLFSSSIIIPNGRRSREMAKRTVCQVNLKMQSLGMLSYAQDNNSNLYCYSGLSSSPREMVFEWTGLISNYSDSDRGEIFYCPSRIETDYDKDPRLWQYSLHIDKASAKYKPKMVGEEQLTDQQMKDNYRYLDYFYLLKKDGVDYPESDIEWVSNIEIVKNPGEKPLIVDVAARDVVSDTFFDIDSPKLRPWGILENSNHKSRTEGKVSGANHAYVDGHVSWVEFDKLTENYTEDNTAYYWKE